MILEKNHFLEIRRYGICANAATLNHLDKIAKHYTMHDNLHNTIMFLKRNNFSVNNS